MSTRRSHNGLELTRIAINPVAGKPRLLAYVQLTLNVGLAIDNVRVIHGDAGRFVAMPSRKGTDGRFHDYAFPIDQAARDWLNAEVLDEYDAVMRSYVPDAEAVLDYDDEPFVTPRAADRRNETNDDHDENARKEVA